MSIRSLFRRVVSRSVRARHLSGVMLLAVAALSPASAQSPSPFATPLASADLDRWITALALEGDQRRAAASSFESTLAESQAFRDDEIAAFSKDPPSASDESVTLEALEQRSRKAKALVARQTAIENRLFDELATLVPETQRSVVERERRAAARRRSAATLDMFVRRGVVPDLISLEPNLASEIRSAEAAGVLLEYDQRLTELMQRAASLALESGPALRKARDAADIEPPGAAGPGDFEGDPRPRMRATAQIRQAALAPLNDVRADIMALHRSTFDRLCQVLPPEQEQPLRSEFIQAHYAAIAIKRDTPERLLRQVRSRANSDEPVPPETIAAAERIIESWRERAVVIERKMMAVVDERRRERGGNPAMFDFGDEGEFMATGGFDDGLNDLRSQRDEATTNARNELASLHPSFEDLARKDRPGPQLAIGGPGGGDAEISVGAVMIIDGDDGGGGAVMFDISPDMIRGSRAGLRAMDRRAFDAMMFRLGWTGADRDRARAAFDAYHTPAEAKLRDALGASNNGGITIGGGGGMEFMAMSEPPAPETLEAAMAQLASDDEAFFVVLGDADDPGLARERTMRARERLRQRVSVGGSPMFQPWGRFEKVELTAILAEATLPADRREHADAIAAAHGERMTVLLGRLLAAHETMRRVEASFRRTIDHGDGRIEQSIEIGPGAGDEFPRAARGLTAAIQAITDEVRRTLDEIESQFPADVARRIRRAAFAQAMPEIVTDPRSAEERLEQAIMLETLSDESRRALIERLAAHQDAVDAIMDRFVEDSDREARERDARRGPGPDEMRAMRRSDGLQQRLRFDRSEVNDASMRRLRALLSAEENRQIADLPPASSSRGAHFALPF